MYTIIGSINTRTFRVIWAMEEMGLKYTHIDASPHSKEIMEINPSGKVPALIVDGTSIIDSVAIIQFLADKHDRLTFHSGCIERAKQDSFTQLINDDFDGLLWRSARNTFILPKEKRVPEIKETLKWEFDQNLNNLAVRLGKGPYLMGEKFCVPDIILTQCFAWARIAGFNLPKEGAIKEYISRVISRSAYKKVVQLSRDK